MAALERDPVSRCREVCRELMEHRLKPYQADSVEGILRHFAQGHTRALLADEVGLGKTETAKGVIARMVLDHWTRQQALPEEERRPFRAAYVCPNQSIARQNLRKLTLFPGEAAASIRDPAGLREALEAARKRCRELDSSVHTRLYEWLRDLCSGQVPDPANYPNDWKKNRNSLNRKGEEQAARLRRDCLEAVRACWSQGIYQVLCGFWESAGGDPYPFNTLTARYLSGLEEDRRLSMQHLYSREDRLLRGNSLLQVDLITPGTSIYPRRGGTYEERALLQASIERAFEEHGGASGLPAFRKEIEDQFSQGVEGYGELLARFRSRIRCVEDAALPDRGELERCFALERAGRIEALRRCFIEKNLENMRYDLVILDEFQNYADILSAGQTPGSEADRIVGKLLGEARVLLLSATPFSSAGGVLEGLEDPDDPGGGRDGGRERSFDPQALGEDWRRLCGFMGGHGQSPAELGIFRATRAAASLHAPIKEAAERGITPDFAYALRLNRADLARCRASYGWTTPYALTFSRGYAFNTSDPQRGACLSGDVDPELFLHLDELEAPRSIPCGTGGADSPFGRLRADLVTRQAAGMLWIPPCTGSLGGPFRGLEGFSKTLIFCSYQMTPRAFAYLLSHEAYCQAASARLRRPPDISREAAGETVRSVLEELTAEAENGLDQELSGYSQTREALLGLFTDLFCEEPREHAACAWDIVRMFYPESDWPDYATAVRQYCADLRFTDMLREYLELLAAEYSGQDENMAGAVRRAGAFEQPEAKLTVRNSGSGALCAREVPLASRFAAGLYTKDGRGSLETQLARLRDAFNSPLRPFVFATTAIGTEGIDLHWYARNVVHWSVPPRPVELEQREGRVLRYNCHAVRLNRALIRQAGGRITEADCLREGSRGKGMYPAQLTFFSDQERTDPAGEGCYHVRRFRYYAPFSPEEARYEAAWRAVGEYRQVLDRLGAPGGEKGDPFR